MRAVFLSDMHVGANAGLADPKVSGMRGAYGKTRAELFKLWCKSVSGSWKRPDALVVVGDIIDGQGPKTGGVEVWTTDLQIQADHAAELLAMWNAKQYYIIRGSHYHTGAGHTGLEMEELIAKQLNAEFYPSRGPKQRSGPSWFLTFNGTTVHASHKVGLSKNFAYRSTPISREMMNAKLNDPMRHMAELYTDMQQFKTQIVVRGHAHYFWLSKTSNSEGIDLPCWEALSPYMEFENPLSMPPDLGFVGIEFLSAGKWRTCPEITRVEVAQCPPHSIVGSTIV